MSIKNRLLAISLAGTAMIGGESFAAQEREAQPTQVSPVQSRFDQICKNVRGPHANLIREALGEIANTPQGAELLSNMPTNIPIYSKKNVEFGMSAVYNTQQNGIMIDSDLMQSCEGKSNRTLVALLEHEMRHAAQDARGMFMEGKKPNVEQLMTVSKLSEAETRAWDIVSGVTYSQIHIDKTGHMTNVEKFMNQELDPSYQKEAIAFQKHLRENKGDVRKAQKSRVGELIKESMSEDFKKDPIWRDRYDTQSLRQVMAASMVDNVSIEGNDKEFQKVLEYYKKEYDISSRHIDEPNVGEKYKVIQKGLEEAMKTGQINPEIQHQIKKILELKGNGFVSNTVPAPMLPVVPSQTSFNGPQMINFGKTDRMG